MAEVQDIRRNRKGDTRGMNPSSQKNLTGKINYAGRPKKLVCVTSWLKEYASELISKPFDVKKLTYAQAAALSAWKAAVKGELAEYNFIIERIEGRLPNPIDLTSKGNEIKQSPIIQVLDLETKELYLNGRRSILETNDNIQKELSGVDAGQTPGIGRGGNLGEQNLLNPPVSDKDSGNGHKPASNLGS